MSHRQPQRPETQPGPIKYEDVFEVSGELASRPIAPQDAIQMQAAENRVLGANQKGGPAAVMQSAATLNEKRGHVRHDDITDLAQEKGITVSETEVSGQHIVTEAVAGQVLAQYAHPGKIKWPVQYSAEHSITIGEALEAAAHSAGDKPVDESDAAAIQAAEIRATDLQCIVPGGVAAHARSAASQNSPLMRDEEKAKLADVLSGAKAKVPSNRPVTKLDAEKIIGAEIRNKPDFCTHPGGVGASMAAAAQHNQGK